MALARTSSGEGSLDGYRRYAIYWAPPRGSMLARSGAAWLGWDAEAGTVPEPPPSARALPLPREAIVARPRRYGFHATLKAPFALAPGALAADLDAAAAALAASMKAFRLPPLVLAEEGDFLALVPAHPCPRLDAVAAACTRALDPFRAPLAPAERARRAEGLTPRQEALLDEWGYPFVLDQFRFHLTLSGPLEPPTRAAAAAALGPVLAPALAEGQLFSEICLFAEPVEGPFRLLRRYALAEGPG